VAVCIAIGPLLQRATLVATVTLSTPSPSSFPQRQPITLSKSASGATTRWRTTLTESSPPRNSAPLLPTTNPTSPSRLPVPNLVGEPAVGKSEFSVWSAAARPSASREIGRKKVPSGRNPCKSSKTTASLPHSSTSPSTPTATAAAYSTVF